jgi:tungstate transport system ATP-binding protein
MKPMPLGAGLAQRTPVESSARPAAESAAAGSAAAGTAAAPDVLLELHEAGVRFGSVQALRGVDLTLARGEVVALVGANGSGKTTLLRLLHGIVGHEGERREAASGLVQAMVFQRPFMLHLSVWNNLLLALWLAGIARREWPERAGQALLRVGLGALRNRPARALSGGEQQRLALARAWAIRPDVLFLDEPTASLDPSAKNAIEALLEGFAHDGMTMVMSTHNLGQAKRLATRMVYLDHGEILLDLPTDRFFAEHGGALTGRADLFLKGELTWELK